MWILLTNPLIRNIFIGTSSAIAIVIGYSFWAIHERNIGYQKAKDAVTFGQKGNCLPANWSNQGVHFKCNMKTQFL